MCPSRGSTSASSVEAPILSTARGVCAQASESVLPAIASRQACGVLRKELKKPEQNLHDRCPWPVNDTVRLARLSPRCLQVGPDCIILSCVEPNAMAVLTAINLDPLKSLRH